MKHWAIKSFFFPLGKGKLKGTLKFKALQNQNGQTKAGQHISLTFIKLFSDPSTAASFHLLEPHPNLTSVYFQLKKNSLPLVPIPLIYPNQQIDLLFVF